MHHLFSTSMPSILRNNRFRRDARSMEEEEEMWFDQDEDLDEGEAIVPANDIMKTKIDTDFDQINKILENRRGRSIISQLRCMQMITWKAKLIQL